MASIADHIASVIEDILDSTLTVGDSEAFDAYLSMQGTWLGEMSPRDIEQEVLDFEYAYLGSSYGVEDEGTAGINDEIATRLKWDWEAMTGEELGNKFGELISSGRVEYYTEDNITYYFAHPRYEYELSM